MTGNTVGTASKRPATRAEELAAFDSLPPIVRKAMREASFPWSAVWIAENSAEWSSRMTVRLIDRSDAAEIRAFSSAYRKRYGRPTPHVAAGATPQTYAAHLRVGG